MIFSKTTLLSQLANRLLRHVVVVILRATEIFHSQGYTIFGGLITYSSIGIRWRRLSV